MSGSSQFVPNNTFGSQIGPLVLSTLDTNFNQVATFLNNPNNYTNYLADTGAANAYVVTFPTGIVPTYTAGLTVFVKIANANTGASTINVSGLGTKSITNPDLTALPANALLANNIVILVYNGTEFILVGGTAKLPLTTGVTGTLPVANGGTNLTSFTSGGVVYASSSSALATGSALTIDSSGNLGLGVTPSAWNSSSRAFQWGANGTATLENFNGVNSVISFNAYRNSSNQFIYTTTNRAVQFGLGYDGQFIWNQAASGTAGNAISFIQAMTLDASGNLGIGTTSPAYRLQVASGLFQSIGTSLISITDTATVYRGTPDGIGYEHAKVYSGRDTTTSSYGSYLSFYTESKSSGTTDTSTERMRIDSSGNLLIGYTTSNGAYKLQVNSQIFATSSTIATSDARYKENVEELSGALDIVKSLRPVSFDWKPHPVHNFDTTTKTVGFLAQDVQQTLADKPYLNSIIKTNECVIEPEVKDENGNVTKEAVTEEFLGIAEGNMISILTAAIKELKAIVDAQALEIATLKGK